MGKAGALRGSGSALRVTLTSEVVSLGVVAPARWPSFHGLGEARDSRGADTGVARVEVVAADLGVATAFEADSGVKGVLPLGESSVRAERMVGSTGVLPDRRRLKDSCRVRRGTAEFWPGMTSGARLFGESGCRFT